MSRWVGDVFYSFLRCSVHYLNIPKLEASDLGARSEHLTWSKSEAW